MRFPITFDNPAALLLLPIAGIVLWRFARNSHAPLDKQQVGQLLVVRLLLVGFLIIALAEPHLLIQTRRLTVLFVMDGSDSIRRDQLGASNRYVTRAIKRKGSQDCAGVIFFGRTPNLENSPKKDIEFTGSHVAVDGSATDLQAAIKVAEAAFPNDAGKRIVLISDGRQNVGDASNELGVLRSQGIQVDVAPVDLDSVEPPETSIDDMKLPEHAQKDAPFPIRLIVTSNVAQKASLILSRDGVEIARQTVSLRPGKNAAVFVGREAYEGTHRYRATLTAPLDTIAQNNQVFGVVSVRGAPRVLYIANSTSQGLDTLKAALGVQGIQMEMATPAVAPKTVTAWQSYDSVLLSDVSATDFAPAQLTTLRDSVKDFGEGLGMIGGTQSFGAGLYGDTPLEESLPVKMEAPGQDVPPAAVVIVLDASGSMASLEDGVEKVQLAAQAGVNLMRSLKPTDEVAVVAVTETPREVVPLQPAANAVSAERKIAGLAAGGGGIYCHTGLVAAYAMLEATKFPIRHVIMCADTTDSEEQAGCVELAQQEYQINHITTSMLGIGNWSDPHVPFQKSVALAGHGQMQAIGRASELPAMFERDVQSIKAATFIEKPVRAVCNSGDALIAGLPVQTAPALLGYNLVTPKPSAVVPMRVEGSGDTLLAYWRYGMGRTFAFTSDDRAHWAARWLNWQGYPRFWAQVVRWSLKSEEQSELQTIAESSGGQGHVVVDAMSPGGDYIDGAHLVAAVADPDGQMHSITLTQTGPGRYEAVFDATKIGAYLLNVRDVDRSGIGQTVGLETPYSPEYRNIQPNRALLVALAHETGGHYLAPADSVFHNAKVWNVGVEDLTAGCLLLTALLLLVDIAWRRLAWKLDRTRFGNIKVPDFSQSREQAPQQDVHEYLNRSASTRISDEDDPYPNVVSKDDLKRL